MFISLTSCSKNSKGTSSSRENIKKTSIFSTYEIGYMNEGNFVSVSEEEFKIYIKNTLELEGSVSYGSFTLGTLSEGYAIRTDLTNAGKYISYSHIMDYDGTNHHYLMAGESCSCTGSCSTGCSASSSGPGDCGCSACDNNNECSKTHSIGSIAAPMFEEE
ncbi:MAG: hypothetical protein CMI36_06285 [Owenweeksia sp.]|nr:hypothetical protein [Owenweeksia sp.]HBF19100.1 hypothetical protein [Cryomorphaceae bacterium]